MCGGGLHRHNIIRINITARTREAGPGLLGGKLQPTLPLLSLARGPGAVNISTSWLWSVDCAHWELTWRNAGCSQHSHSPSSSSLMSLAAWIPSSLRFFSICLLRAREARSSALMAQPMMRVWRGPGLGSARVTLPAPG